MKILGEKRFCKWAKKEGIDHARLVETAKEAFAGQVEADLGGCLFKKRLARDGEGKSGGYRTVLCFRKSDEDRIFFLHGFAKGAKANISAAERKALIKLGSALLSASERQMQDILTLGYLVRIGGDGDDKEK